MNEEIKAKWIDALRSGKYEQGKGYLREAGNGDSGRDKFCCLGVLCDLYVSSDESSIEWQEDAKITVRKVGGRASYLPDLVMEWAGLGSPDGEFSDGGVRYDLPTLNDSGWTFEQIAEVIEKKF